MLLDKPYHSGSDRMTEQLSWLIDELDYLATLMECRSVVLISDFLKRKFGAKKDLGRS